MECKAITTKKIEEIQKAILQLVESKQASSSSSITANDDQHQLLTQLLSQLESLKQDEAASQSELSAEAKKAVLASDIEHKSKEQSDICASDTGIGVEDVAKQLKKVEKQNRTTHWLLSALIVLTIAWQVSEVSILLKLKDGFSHPLKSVGNMVAGMVKRRKRMEEKADQSSLLAKVNGSEDNSLKLPNMDLSGLMNADEE
ncbi:hypothetical protein RDABS01_002411 [Bienertia sinuspersici]